MNSNKNLYAKLIPVMLCFFAMGFVDLVGIASNYVKADLDLTDSQANIFPSLVFFWFLIFSVPTGILMNKIGRKKTVLLSLIVTFASLLLPIFGDGYTLMLISFSLLGIGNALMQTSLNPLLSNIIAGEKLASTLTFGQFVKAIASFLAPYIAMWGAMQAIPTFGLGWRVLFSVYMVIAVFAIVLLGLTPIEEEKPDKASGFKACFSLLGKPFILLSFIGIMCHVGIDVGTNTTAPKILMERLDMTLAEAGFATSLYFIFRTVGCFLGAFILQKASAKSFFALSVVFMLLAMVGLFIFHSETIIYICIAMIGFGNSNVFSIIFSQALFAMPEKKNEVSGLMIMGLFGGRMSNVVEWVENSEDIIFYKWPEPQLKKGCHLVVRPGQNAVYLVNGRIEGIFEDEGCFDIDVDNRSRCEVLFVNTKELTIKWGTQSPVTIPVQGFATGLPIRAFGTFGCKVSDYIAAMDKYAGVRTVYTTDDLRDRVVSVLGSLLMKWITKEGRDIFNLQMNAKEIAAGIKEDLDMELFKDGISITSFTIANFSYPAEVRQAQINAGFGNVNNQ